MWVSVHVRWGLDRDVAQFPVQAGPALHLGQHPVACTPTARVSCRFSWSRAPAPGVFPRALSRSPGRACGAGGRNAVAGRLSALPGLPGLSSKASLPRATSQEVAVPGGL